MMKIHLADLGTRSRHPHHNHNMIRGTFEVHLITKPALEPELFGYVTDLLHSQSPHVIRPRPTCARSLYGDHPVQPMLTFFTTGTVDGVTKLVQEIEHDMEKHGLPVLRTKIEAMVHNEGVPPSLPDAEGTNYYEFHFKVDITGIADWNRLVKIITPYGAHLFFNPYSKTLTPIVTIRRYTSLEDLEGTYADLHYLITEAGFTVSDPEREYSVYDSNVDLDRNWLFRESPSNFITEVTPQMLFAGKIDPSTTSESR